MAEEEKPKFSQEQYDLLIKSSHEDNGCKLWNEWREKNPSIKIEFERANLKQVNLEGAFLEGAFLEGAYLWRANLSRADLSRADLSRADLIGTNLISAVIRSATLARADLLRANLSSANLSSANLFDANLFYANLSSANLVGAYLQRAYLAEAILEGADIRRANLMEANLNKANLNNSKITDVSLYGASITDWKIDNIECECVFWDAAMEHKTKYAEKEFEKRYTSYKTFEVVLKGSLSPKTTYLLKAVVDSINKEIIEADSRIILKETDAISNDELTAKFISIRDSNIKSIKKVIAEQSEKYLDLINNFKKEVFERLPPKDKEIVATGKIVEGLTSKEKGFWDTIGDALDVKLPLAPGVKIDLKKLLGEKGKDEKKSKK